MFIAIFLSILKSYIIPIVIFFLFKDISIAGNPIGENYVFLGVTVALTLSSVFSVIFKLIRVLPNVLLLRGRETLHLILRIFIEVSSIIAFWLYYLTYYAK